MSDTIDADSFFQVDIRYGKVVGVDFFKEARKPAYKLKIDFGDDIGIKNSSAQITENYTEEALMGRHVMAVVNLPHMRVAGFKSEVLTLGIYDNNNTVCLLEANGDIQLGARVC